MNTREIYTDQEAAINRLTNNGLRIDDKTVVIPKSRSVGIKLWGAIDYLNGFTDLDGEG